MKTLFSKKAIHSTRRQRGQGMSEYIIIVAMIAIGAIAIFSAFGGTIRSQVAAMAHELSGTTGAVDVTAAQTNATTASTKAAAVKNMATYAGQQQ